MRKTKLIPFDVTDHLQEDADIAAYLEAAIEQAVEEDNPSIILGAIGDIARARGMGEISKRTKLSRQNLYKALSKGGNPAIDTIFKIVTALGLRLTITPTNSKENKAKKRKMAA